MNHMTSYETQDTTTQPLTHQSYDCHVTVMDHTHLHMHLVLIAILFLLGDQIESFKEEHIAFSTPSEGGTRTLA